MTKELFANQLAQRVNMHQAFGRWDMIRAEIDSAQMDLEELGITGENEVEFWEQVRILTRNGLAIKSQGAQGLLAMSAQIDRQLAQLAQNAKPASNSSTSSNEPKRN